MLLAKQLLKRRPSVFLLALFVAIIDIATGRAETGARDQRVGVGTHFDQDWNVEKVIPLISRSGVGWIRDDMSWDGYEKEKGVYRVPAKTMAWINASHAAGLKIDLVFNGSNNLYAPDIYNSEAYARAAAMAAKELAGKVQAIEILNEPANSGFSKHYGGEWNGLEKDGTVSPWVGKYVELINVAASAIKKANPKIKVIGLGSVPPVNHRQLAMGIAQEVDGIVDHPYSYRTVPELIPYADTPPMMKRDGIATTDERGSFFSLIEMYRKQSAEYRGPKEIWLTEWGWSTYQESETGELFAGFTPSAQAKYISRRLMQSLGLGVDATFIYDFKDDGNSRYNNEDNFGLVDYALNPKPSFTAVQRLTTMMADFRPHHNFDISIHSVNNRPDTYPVPGNGGAKLTTSGNVECYQFADRKGQPLIALWSNEQANGDLNSMLADVEITTQHEVTHVKVTDLFTGTSRTIPFQKLSNRIVIKQITVPDYPIAVTIN